MTGEALVVQGRGLRLAGLVWPGHGAGALLLHGAAGYAGEWSETAAWLAARRRVAALDLRGHAASERRPEDLSLDALAADVEAAAMQLASAPALVVGQSLGGLVAIAAADRRPDLLQALVVVEASPSPDPAAADEVAEWLESWPVPFPSHGEAARFFGAGLHGEAWARGLERASGGFVPHFDPDVVVALVRAATKRDLWREWWEIKCPILVVRGESSGLSTAEAERMAAANPRARVVAVAGAGHDVHLDTPSGWRGAVEAFLDEAVP